MALNHVSIVLLAAAAIACGRAAAPVAEAEEPEVIAVTRWTSATELFAEYPPLVAGRTSRFAIHLTRLDTFKPLTEGRVEVRLSGGGADEVFTVDGPSRPGIFGVDVKPARSGARQLRIALRAAGLADEHAAGPVTVHATAMEAAAAAGAGEDAGGISFLKEQQWSLDFGTALVAERPVRESIRVPAAIEARPGGSADVTAPIDGRLTSVRDAPIGSTVAAGQELARLLPPPSLPGDLPQLQRAQAEAETSVALAVRDRERAERLTAAGAAPQKRLEDARAAEDQARARLRAAEASIAQYTAARTGSAPGADAQFAIRAPIGGVIAHRDAASGANVAAGATLFRIVDAANVHVVGRVPETDAARARFATTAEIEVAGAAGRIPAGRYVSAGKVLDPASRTLPITFALDNRSLQLPVGQSVVLHLLLDAAPPRPAVPDSAVVDDAGRPIVFVQVGGETFERRAVTLGPRAGGVTQVIEGVRAGERVVTRGAFLVRLAALSTTVPAHGHVH